MKVRFDLAEEKKFHRFFSCSRVKLLLRQTYTRSVIRLLSANSRIPELSAPALFYSLSVNNDFGLRTIQNVQEKKNH